MADLCLPLAIEFRQRAAEWRIKEDGVVSESVGAARLRRDLTFDRSSGLEKDRLAVSDGNRAHESSRAPGDAALAEQLLELPELRRIVSPMPSRRLHARRLVERVDLDPRIIRDAHQACRLGVIARLQPRILLKRRPCLLGLDDRLPIVQRQQPHGHALEDSCNFFQLARIGGRDQQRSHREPAQERISPTIDRWRETSSRMPLSASSRRSSRALRSKGGPSAVPCTSMKRPSPVLTTFMSTSARESSSYARSSRGVPSTTPTLVAATWSVTGSVLS